MEKIPSWLIQTVGILLGALIIVVIVSQVYAINAQVKGTAANQHTITITATGMVTAVPDPTIAPAGPRTRHAQKIASCVEAGPGSRLHAAIASSNSSRVSHPRRCTHSSRSSAMCAGGPPKPMHPRRPHSRSTTPSEGRASPRWAVGGAGSGASSSRASTCEG